MQTFLVACTEAVTHQGLAAEGETDQNQNCDHIQFHGDSHGGNLFCTIAEQKMIGQCKGDALHQIGNTGRNTDRKNTAETFSTDMKILRADGKLTAPVTQVPDEICITAQVADHCRDCSAGSTVAQNEDKYRIKDHIDNCTQNRTGHGLGGGSFCTHQIRRCQ